MPFDARKIARRITDTTTQNAAANTAALIDAIVNEMQSPQRRAEFVDALRRALAQRGWRFDEGPKLVLFGLLDVGECFRTLEGKLFCKIEPITYTDDNTSVVVNAYHLESNHQVFIKDREKVEQMGYLMPGLPKQP